MGSADYVSVHHRIRQTLHRRLKHVAVDLGRPVTDIMNEAVEIWLEGNERSLSASPYHGMAIVERLQWLRDQKAEGSAISALASLPKGELVEVCRALGIEADLRLSGDRLVSNARAVL